MILRRDVCHIIFCFQRVWAFLTSFSLHFPPIEFVLFRGLSFSLRPVFSVLTGSVRACWRSGRRGFVADSTRGRASRFSRSRTRMSLPTAAPTRWSMWPHRRAWPTGSHPDPSPKAPQRVPGAPCTGSCSPSTPPPPTRHRPPGGLPPGRFQPLPARSGPGHGEQRPRARLGLHDRDDGHKTPQDRVRLLAGVTAARSLPTRTLSQDSESRRAPIGHTPEGRSAEFGTRLTCSLRCA